MKKITDISIREEKFIISYMNEISENKILVVNKSDLTTDELSSWTDSFLYTMVEAIPKVYPTLKSVKLNEGIFVISNEFGDIKMFNVSDLTGNNKIISDNFHSYVLEQMGTPLVTCDAVFYSGYLKINGINLPSGNLNSNGLITSIVTMCYNLFNEIETI